jgi:hypothetical protein
MSNKGVSVIVRVLCLIDKMRGGGFQVRVPARASDMGYAARMTEHEPVAVIKNDHTGREVWRYQGRVLERDPTCVTVEARFDLDDKDAGFVVYRRDDRFVEYHYSDRWYCIFEIHDVDDDRLKGWYCNFQRPSRFSDGSIHADDLALDLFVCPDGRLIVLDREQFERLPLAAAEREAVLEALDELRRRVERREPPFAACRQG